MSKTVPGLNAEYIMFYNEGTPSVPSIRSSSDTNSGIYVCSGGSVGFVQAGLTTMLVNNGLELYTPLTSTSTISATNLALGVVGSTAPSSANYFGASATTESTKPLYFTYLAAPSARGSFIPSQSYTLYVEGAPSVGTSPFSIYVNSGLCYFGGGISAANVTIGNNLVLSAATSNYTYTIPDPGSNASFVMTQSTAGQTIRCAGLSGSLVKGGILSFGADSGSVPCYLAGGTAYMSYFATQTITLNASSVAATVAIAGPTSGAATNYALMVLSGVSQFNGQIQANNASNAIGFETDATTGISWSSAGTYKLVSGGADVATVSSAGLTMASGKSLDFGSVKLTVGGTSQFELGASGLARIANGYIGSVTSTVSLNATISGTGFSTTSISVPIYYFPMGGKAYFAVISTGTSTAWKTGGSPSSSNYLTITFLNFVAITAVHFEGTVGTYSSTTVATSKHIALKGYMHGPGVASNAIILNFPSSSSLLSSNLWTGTAQALTGYFTGIIFADK